MSATAPPTTTTPQHDHAALAQAWPKVPLAVLGFLLAGLYWPTFQRLITIWYEDPDYSHGFLVIPASLFFGYIVVQRQKASGKPLPLGQGGAISGGVQIVLGLALHGLGLIFDVLIVDVLSLILILRGSVKLIAGHAVDEAFAFPALFLLFMAPLPPVVHGAIAVFMQQAVAGISTAVLEVFGVPVYREGYMIYLPRTEPMAVGEACSGLRSMIAIVALSVAIGFLLNGPKWFRWTLGMLALPVAGFANCLRVVLTGVILMTIGPYYAKGIFHTLTGEVLVVVAAICLLGIAYGLLKFTKPPPANETEKDAKKVV